MPWKVSNGLWDLASGCRCWVSRREMGQVMSKNDVKTVYSMGLQ